MTEEVPTRIEPTFFEDTIPSALSDLVVDIRGASATLGQGLHEEAARELADMVRVMNCYYSNLIEGHNTRPRDIELALAGAEIEEAARPLALEAKAHVIVQREIDDLFYSGRLPPPTSSAFISWTHRRFYEEMPEEFRFAEHDDGNRTEIVPGRFRTEGDNEVAVGRHQPPSSKYVSSFVDYFSNRYQAAESSATNRIISIAAAHHRLNYIHPFIDGNGRVSRLMSHAMALKAGIGGNGLWSISRGLARGLNDKNEYKRMMDYADHQRMGDRDGRGNLSAKALQDYCEWFLSVALDQINFSKAVFAFETLEGRYRKLVSEVLDDARAPEVISAVLKRGSLERGEVPMYTGTPERTSRNTLRALVNYGFLKSSTPKSPVRIAFPLEYRDRLFPNLFADAEMEPPKPSIPSYIAAQMTQKAAISARPAPLAQPDLADKLTKRLDTLTALLGTGGVSEILAETALLALKTHPNDSVDWQQVENEVISKSIGEQGKSRALVIDTLQEFSPGTITQEQIEDLTDRVIRMAPGLVAKFNERFAGKGPRR